MKGLKIKEKWINLILDGTKTWEIRGSNTRIRGRIFLVMCGKSQVYGETTLIETIPLNEDLFEKNRDKHNLKISFDELLKIYKKPYAWVFKDSEKFETPKRFHNLQGAVKWVNIEEFLD